VSGGAPSVDPGLRYAFQRLHADETALAAQLNHVCEQHRSEHEIHHVTRDLLTWSRDNLAQIEEVAEDHRIRLPADLDGTAPSTGRPFAPSVLAHQESTPTDPQLLSGLRLLDDLRTTHLLAVAASLSWELLAQHAQARHKTDVLELTSRCHPRTLRQMRWANTMLKTQSPQALTTL
jgi:hypothetical protein